MLDFAVFSHRQVVYHGFLELGLASLTNRLDDISASTVQPMSLDTQKQLVRVRRRSEHFMKFLTWFHTNKC